MKAVLAGGALDQVRRLVERVAADGGLRDQLTDEGAIRPLSAAAFLPPVPDPSLVLALGLSYRDHLAEMHVEAPDRPSGFPKAPSSLNAHRAPIVLPRSHPDMVDYEAELAIVIGRPCFDADEEEAAAAIAGYTIANDVSARDWVKAALDPQQTPMQAALSWQRNLAGKQFPGFTPLGPFLVTADSLADAHDLAITTRLNGTTMQAGNTRDLIFPLPRIVSHFSRTCALCPGDIISTGTPAGVGYAHKPPRFLRPGDVVEVTIEGLGSLANPVVAAGGPVESGYC